MRCRRAVSAAPFLIHMKFLKKIRTELKKQNGAVEIIEASFVFPIAFIILFFLIFFGNAFLVKAQVETIVAQEAIRGAAYCADPLLETIKETGGVPSVGDLKTDPYRYLFGGMDKIEKEIEKNVKDRIGKETNLFFSTMTPKLKSGGKIASFNNMVVYSTFSVNVEYTIQFPIRFLGENTPEILHLSSFAESAVDDTSEFIRNTDMVLDMVHGTELAARISDVFAKVNDFISTFAEK